MKKLNNYINEAWGGVKKQSLKADIEAWCEGMDMYNYTINSQGEIDANGDVDLRKKDFKELPYKFGKIKGSFSLRECKNLTSLKNCPDEVEKFFSCSFCPQLDSLKECPKKVRYDFFCSNCKREFTKKEVMALCDVKEIGYIHI